MRLGATLVHLSDAPQRDTAVWARQLEAAGFESLWTPEVIGRTGVFVPDPFVTLAVAATATRDVEVGTATVQVPLHHTAELAQRMLSLTAVAGDRLSLGVSPGASAEDYAALDRDPGTRFPTFRREVGRLRTLLTDGRDEHADLAAPPARVPPLLLGTWGVNVERAAREFDGWLVSGHRRTPDQVLEAHDRYRAFGGQRAVVCTIPVNDREDLDPTRAVLRRYAQAGIDDAVVLIGPDGPEPARVRDLLP